MLRTNIEPILYEGKVATRILTRVDLYDMRAQRCILYFKMANDEDGAYHIETWEVPSTILSGWGTDDAVLVQALADEKGFAIIP